MLYGDLLGISGNVWLPLIEYDYYGLDGLIWMEGPFFEYHSSYFLEESGTNLLEDPTVGDIGVAIGISYSNIQFEPGDATNAYVCEYCRH